MEEARVDAHVIEAEQARELADDNNLAERLDFMGACDHFGIE